LIRVFAACGFAGGNASSTKRRHLFRHANELAKPQAANEEKIIPSEAVQPTVLNSVANLVDKPQNKL
jgi:hypothetical protein